MIHNHYLIPENQVSDKYMVAYAKFNVDKDQGIILGGVFFGGVGESLGEAESIARDCVNTVRGTVMPKLIKLESDGQIIDALYDATEKFEKMASDMLEADAIVNRTRKKK